MKHLKQGKGKVFEERSGCGPLRSRGGADRHLGSKRGGLLPLERGGQRIRRGGRGGNGMGTRVLCMGKRRGMHRRRRHHRIVIRRFAWHVFVSLATHDTVSTPIRHRGPPHGGIQIIIFSSSSSFTTFTPAIALDHQLEHKAIFPTIIPSRTIAHQQIRQVGPDNQSMRGFCGGRGSLHRGGTGVRRQTFSPTVRLGQCGLSWPGFFLGILRRLQDPTAVSFEAPGEGRRDLNQQQHGGGGGQGSRWKTVRGRRERRVKRPSCGGHRR